MSKAVQLICSVVDDDDKKMTQMIKDLTTNKGVTAEITFTDKDGKRLGKVKSMPNYSGPVDRAIGI